jgi:hypothetical protein
MTPSSLPKNNVSESPWNVHRLVSLWEIMNLFDAPGLMVEISMLSRNEECFRILTIINQSASKEEFQHVIETLKSGQELCLKAGLIESCHKIDLGLSHLTDYSKVDMSTIRAEIRHIREGMITEMFKRKFLQVSQDSAEYLENESLFGARVKAAFPSATDDIKEAGNCFAAECPTASVFHLMRAAEVGLRAVARDREIEFSDKPLEQKEWGTILDRLDAEVKRLRQETLVKWKKPEIKDEQVRFYAGVAQELRSFNEAWRRYISHARQEAFVDTHYAASILDHVRIFLQKLAERIDECTKTPVYWEAL